MIVCLMCPTLSPKLFLQEAVQEDPEERQAVRHGVHSDETCAEWSCSADVSGLRCPQGGNSVKPGLRGAQTQRGTRRGKLWGEKLLKYREGRLNPSFPRLTEGSLPTASVPPLWRAARTIPPPTRRNARGAS